MFISQIFTKILSISGISLWLKQHWGNSISTVSHQNHISLSVTVSASTLCLFLLETVGFCLTKAYILSVFCRNACKYLQLNLYSAWFVFSIYFSTCLHCQFVTSVLIRSSSGCSFTVSYQVFSSYSRQVTSQQETCDLSELPLCTTTPLLILFTPYFSSCH